MNDKPMAMLFIVVLLIGLAVWAFYEPHPDAYRRPQGSAFTIGR